MEVVDHVGPGLLYSFPLLPIRLALPGGVRPGTEVSIQGTIPSGASRFSINFQQGVEKASSPVAFHFNPRFTEGPVVVRNSRVEGSWLQEERSLLQTKFPFAHKEDFRLVITPTEEWFQVVVDGKHLLDFKYRLPLDVITHLCVKGDVFVKSIHVSAPLPTLCVLSTPGKLKIGETIFVQGKVNADAASFSINLLCGEKVEDDICLHINPRFNQGSVVRNSRLGGEWGPEETAGGLGPLGQDQDFELAISAGIEHYVIRLNGVHFAAYDHRVPIHSAVAMFVEGDVTVRSIIFDSQPIFLSELFEARELSSRDSRVRSVLPIVPVKVPIGGTLGKGAFVVVTFVPKLPNNKLQFNLQKGSEEDADICLHVNPRWDQGPKPVIVLNSRTGGTWGEEVLPEPFPLQHGQHSDLVIHCLDDHYRVALNGRHLVDFPARLHPSVADTVNVEGDVVIKRILVL